MTKQFITAGIDATFISPSGREIPVVVKSLGLVDGLVTVAMVSDPAKTKQVDVMHLRTKDGAELTTEARLVASAQIKPLQDELNSATRYACLECGAKHNRHICPQCGSQERIENV